MKNSKVTKSKPATTIAAKQVTAKKSKFTPAEEKRIQEEVALFKAKQREAEIVAEIRNRIHGSE